MLANILVSNLATQEANYFRAQNAHVVAFSRMLKERENIEELKNALATLGLPETPSKTESFKCP